MMQSGTNKIRILGRSALCHSAVLGYPDLEGGCRGWGGGGVSDGEGKVIKCVLTVHWCQDQGTPLPSGMDPPSYICIFEIQNALKTEGIFFLFFFFILISLFIFGKFVADSSGGKTKLRLQTLSFFLISCLIEEIIIY